MRIVAFVITALTLAACSPSAPSAERGPAFARPGSPAGTPAPLVAGSSPGAASASPPAEGRAHTVTLTVSGTVRRATVTYAGPDGRERHSVVSPPWSRTFAVRDGQSLDVTAHSDSGGSLGCALKADGEVLKSAMSSGDSMTVDCGDSIDF